MQIFFGTIHLGSIARHKKQSVKTKFFFVFVFPLFPVRSVFVTEPGVFRLKGKDIPMNTKSILATYARFYLLLIAVLLWVKIMGQYRTGAMEYAIATVITLAWIYFMFWYGKTTAHEKELRNKLHWSTGTSLLPYWLDSSEQLIYLRDLEHAYERMYSSFTWKADVKENPGLVKQRPILYALAVYNYLVFTVDENNQMLDKIALALPPDVEN